MNTKLKKRILSALLAVLMFLCCLPVRANGAQNQEESTETVADCAYCGATPAEDGTIAHGEDCNMRYAVDADADVGKYAQMADPECGMEVIDGSAGFGLDQAVLLFGSDFESDPVFHITDWYWDVETTALWYQVELYSGAILEESAEYWPADPWILQDYTDTNYEYDAALTFVTIEEPTEPTDPEETEPEETEPTEPDEFVQPSQPVNIVSANGITVSLDKALLTGFTVTETKAPAAYYIHRAIAYDMVPNTADGKYTGHAVVTIPIPEGWDRDKLFGFVREADGTMTALFGTVTKFGTFQFAVPHFSEVGLFEATAVSDVQNKTISFGKIQSDYRVVLDGHQGDTGRYVSSDGAVQYVVNQVTLSDGSPKTYVSLTGLDVTPGTEILIGNTSVVVIVEPLVSTVAKLLTGGTANSIALDPLYDVGISGTFTIEYAVTAGDNCLTLSDNTITAVAGANGNATVTAQIKHPSSGKIVGYVTYEVTVTNLNVTGTVNVHVPVDGTTTISVVSGELNDTMLDENIANNVFLSNGELTLNGVAEGRTAVVVGSVLYEIFVHPNRVDNDPLKTLTVNVTNTNNCTLYYAVNGGALIPVTSTTDVTTLIQQSYADGINIMFFSAPKEGYVTTGMSIDGSAGQYYCLSNGSRYDGSDSDAWPLNDSNAQSYPTENNDYNGTTGWKTGHGFRWALLEGNMTLDQMRDLFTRALALGCESVTTITKNSTDGFETNVSVATEKLPTFEKTIVKIVRNSVENAPVTKEFDSSNPYDPATEAPLEIGDVVTYQFAINVESSQVTYDFTISDPSIGYEKELSSTKNSYEETVEYVLAKDKSQLYAGGEFVNTASLSYKYKSDVATGKTTMEATSSATCRISSIVTWQDNYGKVWRVDVVNQGEPLPTPPDVNKYYYSFTGWNFEIDGLTDAGDDTYTVDYGAESSLTIIGTFVPDQYSITYELEGGTLPDGTANPTQYTVESLLTIPEPTRAGYTFDGWRATVSGESNWAENVEYPPGMVLLNKHGNVTLTAGWTAIPYTYTFDPKNGTAVTSGTATAGETITLPQVPDTLSYRFLYWERQDDKTHHEASATFTMPASNVTFVAQWDDVPVLVGINMQFYKSGDNMYYDFPPGEPAIVDTEAARVYKESAQGTTWKIQQDGWGKTLPGVATDYIKSEIFNTSKSDTTEGYVERRDGNGNVTVAGVFDETGKVTKDLLYFDDTAYTGIIQAWIKDMDYLQTHFTNVNIDWDQLSDNSNDYEIIPYVIKRHQNGSIKKPAWHIDVIVIPTARYTVKYVLNLAEGYSATVPTDSNMYGKGYKVDVEGMNDVSRTDNPNYVAKFKGWVATNDTDNSEISISTDNRLTMPASNITLTAQWEYYAPLTISQKDLANNESAIYQITGNDVDLKVALTGTETIVAILPVGEYTVTEIAGNWTWKHDGGNDPAVVITEPELENQDASKVTVANTGEESKVEFTFANIGSDWLHGENHRENNFAKVPTP